MSSLAVRFGLFLILMSWLASNHYPPWVTSHSELLASLAALLLLVAAVVETTKTGLPVPISAAFLCGLAAIPLMQSVFGEVMFFGDAWIAALYLTCAACVVAASNQLATRPDSHWPYWFASTLLLGAIVSSCLAWMQALQLSAGSAGIFVMAHKGGAPYANLGQRNQLATLLALGVGGIFYLFEKRRVSAPFALTAAIWLVATIALTRSRMPALMFLAGCAVVFFYRRRQNLRTTHYCSLGLAIAWLGFFLLTPYLFDWLGLTGGESLEQRMKAGARTVIWPQLWAAVWRSPLVGYGWNQVSVAQVAVAADYPTTEWAEHSHNLILDLLIWNGVPIAMIIMCLACIWLVRRMRSALTVESIFGLLIIALLLAHAMVEFPLDYLYFLVPFAIAIGLVENAARTHLFVMRWPFPPALVAVAFAVVAWAALDYWRVEEANREMRLTVARIGRPMPEQAPPPPQTQFTQLSAYLTFALTQPRQGMSERELADMQKVAHRYADPPSLYRYALAQALNGDLPGARHTLIQLRQLHGVDRYSDAKRELAQLAHTSYPILQKLELP